MRDNTDDSAGICTDQNFYPEFSNFIDELRLLCAKHGVAVIHKPDSVHVLSVGDGELLGRVLYAHEGRLGYAPEIGARSKLRVKEPS